MPSTGKRIGVVGATGALGGEVLSALAASGLRIGGILPIATERSLGQDIEFQDEIYAVETDARGVRSLDLLMLCAPADASLEFAREALRASVPCIDLSGALADTPDVPLRIAAVPPAPEAEGLPLISTPPGAALAWALALRPIEERAGLRRVVGVALEGASAAGRRGIEALYEESLAIFNQREQPDPEVFPAPVAFDCMPAAGALDADGSGESELQLARSVARLLDSDAKISATRVQIPVFVGHGAVLSIETERPVTATDLEEALAKSPGVELSSADPDGPTTRAASGRDVVLVGRVRADPTAERSFQIWLAADLLRLAATNAVELARMRLRTH